MPTQLIFPQRHPRHRPDRRVQPHRLQRHPLRILQPRHIRRRRRPPTQHRITSSLSFAAASGCVPSRYHAHVNTNAVVSCPASRYVVACSRTCRSVNAPHPPPAEERQQIVPLVTRCPPPRHDPIHRPVEFPQRLPQPPVPRRRQPVRHQEQRPQPRDEPIHHRLQRLPTASACSARSVPNNALGRDLQRQPVHIRQHVAPLAVPPLPHQLQRRRHHRLAILVEPRPVERRLRQPLPPPEIALVPQLVSPIRNRSVRKMYGFDEVLAAIDEDVRDRNGSLTSTARRDPNRNGTSRRTPARTGVRKPVRSRMKPGRCPRRRYPRGPPARS